MFCPNPFFRQLLATLIACLSVFCWGTSTGWNNVADYQLRQNFSLDLQNKTSLQISNEESSWISACHSIGGIIGSLTGGFLCEWTGRKRSLQIICSVATVSFLIASLAWNIWVIWLTRILLGFTSSAASSASSLYVSEISSAQYRGQLGSCVSLITAFGVSFSVILGAFLNWRFLSALCCISPLLGFIGMIFMPESPYYHSQKDQKDHAKKSLQWLLCGDEVLVEKARHDINDYFKNHEITSTLTENEQEDPDCLDDIEEIEEKTSNLNQDSHACYKLMVMSVIMAFARLNGVTQITCYMVDMLRSARVTSVSATYASAGISIFEAVGSVFSVLLSDKAGRRPLLIWSGLGMGITNIFLWLNQSGILEHQAIPVISMSAFFVTFTLGFGGIPFVILGEVFAPNRKGLAVSISVTFLWILNLVNAKSYFWILDLIGYSGMYATFAVCSIFSAIFVAIFLPETKNKSLAQVQEEFQDSRFSF